MKGNHWFIAGIIVFLVLMFAIECRLPKKFVWNPTFSHCLLYTSDAADEL